MQKKRFAVPIGLLILILFGTPLLLLAADFRSGDQVSLPIGEIITDDVYATGGTITSSGNITADLYAGGGTIVVSGSVSSDAVLGGGTVTVLGAVGDDVRIGGGTVVVQGTVQGDVVIGGGQVTIGGQGIAGDVLIGAGSVTIEAPIGGDVKIGGGDIVLNSAVAGNVHVKGEELTLGPQAVIEGNLIYSSPREVVMTEGALVRGEVTYEPMERKGEAALGGLITFFTITKLLMLLAGALIFGLLLRRLVGEIIQKGRNKPLLEFGRGLAALIAIPIISALLFVTIIGIPLGILGIIAYIGMLIFAWFMAPILLGSLLLQWWQQGEIEVSWKSILLGVVVYSVLDIIPILGGLAQFALFLIAVGATLRLKWDITKEWR